MCLVVVMCSLSAIVSAQARRSKNPRTPKKAAPETSVPVTKPSPTPTPPSVPLGGSGSKRNERPASASAAGQNGTPGGAAAKITPVYFYQFERPGFQYTRILIEHDDAGRGQISFLKHDFEDLMTDPIELSPVTVSTIKDTLAAMNFLDSAESYQYAKDYGHLGNITYTVRRDGRERTAKFNWTDHKHARMLMDEYRRITNEYTWRFEIMLARENQPLQTPGLMDTIDRYVGRGEISDPQHLIPFLKQLSTDERLPLMARNRAEKIIKQIEKAMK